MDPKGYVMCKKEFTATKMWPNPQFSLHGFIDLEKAYKEALAGNLVVVMDIAVDDSGYLLLGRSKEVGDFLWTVEKEDTVAGSFLPVIWKYGVLMPTGLSPMEEFAFLARSKQQEAEQYKKF